MNPQSFNRYSYCLNNPLKYIDPSGHDVIVIGSNGSVTIPDAYAGTLDPSQPYAGQLNIPAPGSTLSKVGFEARLRLVSGDSGWDLYQESTGTIWAHIYNIDDCYRYTEMYANYTGSPGAGVYIAGDLFHFNPVARYRAVGYTSYDESPFCLLSSFMLLGISVAGQTGGRSNPLINVKYSQKVLNDMAGGDYHNFPDIVDNYGAMGELSRIQGGDSKMYNQLKIYGSYDNKTGYFHYIWDNNGVLQHRLFVPFGK